jgi:hypothetical protein
MDSSQEAHQANIKTSRYAFWQLIVTIVIGVPTLVLLVWQQWNATPPSPGQGGGRIMGGWVPIVIIAVVIGLSALSLLITSFRLQKNKKLLANVSTLEDDLTKANSDFGAAQSRILTCEDAYKRLEKERDGVLAEKLVLSNEMALATPSKRLRDMEDKDAVAIHDAVVLSAIQFRNETAYGFRYVDFVFSVFNQSVYPISIDSIGPGNIVFNRDEFVKEKKLEDNKAQNVEPRRDGNFTIRQFLDLGDMSAINEATDDRVFRFDNLTVNIKGGAGFEDVVKLSQLKIDCYSLSKQYPLWRNYNIGPFHSRFNGEITGRVRGIFFQSDWLDSYEPGQDHVYDLFFVLKVFIVNHGDPKSIERFRLAVKVNEEIYEGERESLAGFQVISRDREPQPIKDIEDDNDENLFEKRGGWLRFRVRGVKGYKEDKTQLDLQLDAIDKNLEPNRLMPPPHSEWLGHAHFQESHVLGSGKWAESEMKAYPENQINT